MQSNANADLITMAWNGKFDAKLFNESELSQV